MEYEGTEKTYVAFTEEERRIIFAVLVNYTEQLAKLKDDHNISHIGLSNAIIKINNLAYDNFNV